METISRHILTFLSNAAWQLMVVAAVTTIAGRLLRNGPASYRHAVWVASLIIAVSLPAASIWQRDSGAGLLGSIQPPAVSVVAPARPTVSRVPVGRSVPVRFSPALGNVIVGVYLGFLLFRAAASTRAYAVTRRLRRTATQLSPGSPLDAVWNRCRRAFGITQIDLLSSGSIAGPLTVGALRPAIVIPDRFETERNEEVLTAALGHEAAHIARHDFVLNLLYELISIPISFHPACWLIRRNIERTREMACDEAVTSRLLDPPAYARSIMHLVDKLVGAEPPGYTLGVFDGNILESRIRRVLKRPAFNAKRARLLLAASASAMVVCAVIASSLAVTARAQSPYQSEMKLAGDAYNGGDFQTAATHFAAAVDLASGDVSPRLFLANALLRAYHAQRESPDSRLLTAARSQYERVVEQDPNSPQALAGLTTLAMQAKEFDQAREWAEKLSAASPNDKTVWYTLGVLDWTAAYQGYQHAKQASGAPQESYIIPDSSLRQSFRDAFRGRVEDGLNVLQRALALDPQYGDAMAYKNLLYRLKAAMMDDPLEAKDLIAKADAIMGEALAARKANLPEPESHRIDVEGPPPGPSARNAILPAPPPPPPPPRDRADQPASASAPPPSEPGATIAGSYWQVLGPNPDTLAIDLFRQLRSHGFQAALHAGSDKLTRVVVGPFFDDPSAQRAREKLESAGFRVLRKWQ